MHRARLPPIQALQTRSGRLTCMLSGSGRPHIVLFSGAGVAMQGWETLYPQIERLGTVFAWNRFGIQGSDPPREHQTGSVVLASLRELLGYTGLEPPYVLVAHSLGGLFANLYARLHPQEVAAVLFIEAVHARERTLLQKQETQLVRSLEKVTTMPQMLFGRNVQTELACLDDTVREVAAAGDFPPVPVRVITGGLSPASTQLSPAAVAAKRANQQGLARLSPRGVQVIAQRSGHFPQLTEPQLVLRTLSELIALL